MPQDRANSESNYRRFVERVRETEEVWGLQFKEGWAYSESNEYEDAEVLLFWSDRADAQKHVEGEWSEHVPTAIPLDEFIDHWLQGMDEDGALVGPNWEPGVSGVEVEPRDLAEKLTSDSL